MRATLVQQAQTLTDSGFRVLVALDASTPPEATEQFLTVGDIAQTLPTSFRAVRRALAELEFQGFIHRRRLEGHLCLDLLYRRDNWQGGEQRRQDCLHMYEYV